MRRRRVIILAGCLVAAGILIVALWLSEREPKYEGVPLTAWLCTFDSYFGSGKLPTTSEMESAATAIHRLGTNSLPFLLQWLSYEPGPWRGKLRGAIEKFPYPVNRLGRLTDRTMGPRWELRHRLALYGFILLGPDASPAIPELRLREQATNSPQVAFHARLALSHIRGDRLSLNLATLADSQSPPLLRAFAAHNLALMGTNEPAVRPALVRALEDPDFVVRFYATNALLKTPPE